MKKAGFILVLSLASFLYCCGQIQTGNKQEERLLFRGIVRDASTLSPLPESQIFINKSFITASDSAGEFSFLTGRKDSVLFKHLGYKPFLFTVIDTLAGNEFMAGVYLSSDTISIDEVIIVPKTMNFRSSILNTPVAVKPEYENAKYNVAVAAYQGKATTGVLGDPSANYNVVRNRILQNAREKGQIPSDRIAGISPFTILPMAYLLLKGWPENTQAMQQTLTKEELDQINKKYLESVRQKQKLTDSLP